MKRIFPLMFSLFLFLLAISGNASKASAGDCYFGKSVCDYSLQKETACSVSEKSPDDKSSGNLRQEESRTISVHFSFQHKKFISRESFSLFQNRFFPIREAVLINPDYHSTLFPFYLCLRQLRI
jgi:hypothetical protein